MPSPRRRRRRPTGFENAGYYVDDDGVEVTREEPAAPRSAPSAQPKPVGIPAMAKGLFAQKRVKMILAVIIGALVLLIGIICIAAVSYTHLTLPTIYSV